MKKTFKIVNSILVFSLLFSLAVFPAGAKAKGNTPNPNSPQTTQPDFAQLVPYMSISEDGFFALNIMRIPASISKQSINQQSIKWVQNEFSGINAHLKGIPLNERPSYAIKNAQGKTQIQASSKSYKCVWVANWILDAVAWTVIVIGGAYATIGLFLTDTIYGIPFGAIYGAIGIGYGVTGTFLLWYVDKYYPKGVNVCY